MNNFKAPFSTAVSSLVLHWCAAFACLYIATQTYAQPVQTAECKLQLIGYGTNSSRSSRQYGVASAVLACSSSAGLIPIAINTTYMQKQTSAFTGVNIVGNPDCKRQADRLSEPMYALLYFCGNYKLALAQPVIKDIYLPQRNSFGDDYVYHTGIVMFGGKVNATISAGQIQSNSAGSIFAAVQQAQLLIDRTNVSNSTGLTGVGVWAAQASKLTVRNSTFSRLKALAGSGGAIRGSNTSDIQVISSRLVNNSAIEYGGSLFLENNSTVLVHKSHIVGSSAEYGAGMYLDVNASALLNQSHLDFNNATIHGAGLYAYQATKVSLYNCTFANNTALRNAGGACFDGPATMQATVQNCTFLNNQAANYSGGIRGISSSSVSISASTFRGNNAALGGAIDCSDRSTCAITSSMFDENSASRHGGALYLEDDSHVRIQSCNISFSQATNTGGGIFIGGKSNTTMHGCVLFRNNATHGGGILAGEVSKLDVRDSNFLLNSAGGNAGEGGGMAVWRTAQVKLSNCTFDNNTALDYGGGLSVANNATAALNTSSLVFNTAKTGGGIIISGFSNVSITRTTVAGNTATESGGGMVIYQNAQVALTETIITGNNADQGGGLRAATPAIVRFHSGSLLQYNNATRGGGIQLVGQVSLVRVQSQASGSRSGYLPTVSSAVVDVPLTLSQLAAIVVNNTARYDNDMSVTPTEVAVVGDTFVPDFVSRTGAEEGVLTVQLHVTGLLGLPCDNILAAATLDNETLAATMSDKTGTVSMMFRLREPAGLYNITFTLPEHQTVPAASMTVQVRSCIKGEVTPIADTCLVCVPGFYSLNTSAQQCETCPNNTICPGGAAIVPELGYWHSAPESPQIHRCPNTAACQGNRQQLIGLHQCMQNGTCPEVLLNASSYADKQCTDGYKGNICGQCIEGLGLAKPFHCLPCKNLSAIISLYAVGALVMLGFIKLLCHFNLAESCASASVQQEREQLPTELLRCLVLYSQRVLLIATINGLDWPSSLNWPLKVVGWVWATSSPETLSIDCVLTSVTIPIAVQRVLFYLLAPVAMLVLLLLIESVLLLDDHLHSSATVKATARDRIAGCTMITAFFFLPSVLRIVFGMFACIALDQPVLPPYQANAVGSFWVYDVSTMCFTSYHRAVALGLGLPLLLLLCIGMPAAIVYKTVANRKQLDDPAFKQHYGFLTVSYRPSKCWWEAVVTLETTVLVAISVFGVNLGAFYQSLLMCAALAVMVQLQFHFKPYVHNRTGLAMLRGTQCLLMISFVGLSFLNYGTVQAGPVYSVVMGVALLLVNFAYVLSVLWMLSKSIDWRKYVLTMPALRRFVNVRMRSLQKRSREKLPENWLVGHTLQHEVASTGFSSVGLGHRDNAKDAAMA